MLYVDEIWHYRLRWSQKLLAADVKHVPSQTESVSIDYRNVNEKYENYIQRDYANKLNGSSECTLSF